MTNLKTPQNELVDIKVNLKVKLATLWASLMFLIIYLDYFHLYMPGKMQQIQTGRVFEFNISQGFILFALTSVTIPAIMIFLSIALPPKLNRLSNIFLATIYIPYMLFNLAGEAWAHMIGGVVVDVVLLSFIVRYAWQWPRMEQLEI